MRMHAPAGGALLVATVFAVVLLQDASAQHLSNSIDDIVPETDAKHLFVLRESPGSKARSRMHPRYVLHDEHHDVIEVFAHSTARKHFESVGFELVEVISSGGFDQKRTDTISGGKSDGYHNLEQLHDAFEELQKKYPAYAQLFSLTQHYKMPKTVKGNEIFAMKISDNVANDEAEPNVLLVSNHHARELIVPELALHTATKLLESTTDSSDDTATKKLLDGNQIYIIFTMNPDGLQAVWHKDAYIRDNANGVDLNRNYPIGFKSSCGGSTHHDSECFRGANPFSEIETQTMRAFQDDRNFAKLMDFHSYSREVRVNYGPCATLPIKFHQLFLWHAEPIAKAMRYQASQSCCMGGDIHFAFNRHGSLAYLVETGNQFQPPAPKMQKELTRAYPGILKFLQIPIPVVGVVQDAVDKTPVKGAELMLQDAGLKLEERASVTNPTGLYHVWIPKGEWKVKVTAPGYATQVIKVRSGTKRNVQLEKDKSSL